jgi:2-methylcitrate dehydratase
MVYIIATLLRKAFERYETITKDSNIDELWKTLMLTPQDYSEVAITNPVTRKLMDKIEFHHGGPEYDSKYPEGIPTSISIETVQSE